MNEAFGLKLELKEMHLKGLLVFILLEFIVPDELLPCINNDKRLKIFKSRRCRITSWCVNTNTIAF